MDWIYDYVMRICAMTTLTMLLKLLLPDGRIMSSADKVMSLALLACIAQPLLTLL